MLIELGRQIPKQPHSKSMHGRFHGQDANAVREKQSMKPTPANLGFVGSSFKPGPQTSPFKVGEAEFDDIFGRAKAEGLRHAADTLRRNLGQRLQRA